MLNKLSLILLVTIHEIFPCISLRAKRSNLIVPHAAITGKILFALVPAPCVEMYTKRALTITEPVIRCMAEAVRLLGEVISSSSLTGNPGT
ncbi:MAG: hypothetical protein J7L16_08485 [Deltaproteobacteria bacterium]|nr:hypothetical protein [Deltaproteobacteria bacterium]